MCTRKECCHWLKKRIYHCWFGCKIPGCEWGGCCKCPHGPCYTVMGVIGGFGGCWMNLYVLMSCKFQWITKINPVTGEPIESTHRGYGLMARELAYGEEATYQSCILYPEDELEYLEDGWMKSARIFAFAAGLLGLVSFGVLILAYCCLFTPWTFERWILWAYLYASMFMALTMLLFGWEFCQESKCKVGNGTGYAISSFMTYLMLANTVKGMGQPPSKAQDMVQPGGREDDYWYDDEEERFMEDSEEEGEDEFSQDDDDREEFEDELNEPRPRRRRFRRRRGNKEGEGEEEEEGTFANLSRAQAKDGEVDTHAFDEMQEYMTPEDRYAPTQDESFLEHDYQQQQPYREQQQKAMEQRAAQQQQRFPGGRGGRGPPPGGRGFPPPGGRGFPGRGTPPPPHYGPPLQHHPPPMHPPQQQQQPFHPHPLPSQQQQQMHPPAAPVAPGGQNNLGVGYEEPDPDDHLGDRAII